MLCSIHKLYILELGLAIPKAIILYYSLSKAMNTAIISPIFGGLGEKHI